jgi:hypothetical protein
MIIEAIYAYAVEQGQGWSRPVRSRTWDSALKPIFARMNEQFPAANSGEAFSRPSLLSSSQRTKSEKEIGMRYRLDAPFDQWAGKPEVQAQARALSSARTLTMARNSWPTSK